MPVSTAIAEVGSKDVTATVQDFSAFVGKKVILQHNTTVDDKPETVEIPGELLAWNSEACCIKPKGLTQVKIINSPEIEDIRLADSESPKIKVRTLRPIELGGARTHLLDRHGMTLTSINEISEEDAFSFHETINHQGEDLGHVHVAPKADSEDASSE